VLHVDEETTVIYGALDAELRRRGLPIPTNDIWIAALTLQHGLTLYTRDPHFSHLPQVATV
jgi:predicted nucleic acid-binding protein